jgi:DNA-binding winged helix-turn-helix (wHTH) protein
MSTWELAMRRQVRAARLLLRATRAGGDGVRPRTYSLQQSLGRSLAAAGDHTVGRIGRHLLACARTVRQRGADAAPAAAFEFCRVRLRVTPVHLRRFLDRKVVDVVIDEQRGVVSTSKGEWVARDQPILFKLLNRLASAAGMTISLAELFEAAWGRRYNPEYDSNPLYFQVGSIRRHLEELGLSDLLQSDRGGYRLGLGVRIARVYSRAVIALDHGREAALRLVRRDGFVTSATYRQCTGVSRTSAHSVLRGLVENKQLVAIGRGRTVRYSFATTS